jgi:hypothetical protein
MIRRGGDIDEKLRTQSGLAFTRTLVDPDVFTDRDPNKNGTRYIFSLGCQI